MPFTVLAVNSALSAQGGLPHFTQRFAAVQKQLEHVSSRLPSRVVRGAQHLVHVPFDTHPTAGGGREATKSHKNCAGFALFFWSNMHPPYDGGTATGASAAATSAATATLAEVTTAVAADVAVSTEVTTAVAAAVAVSAEVTTDEPEVATAVGADVAVSAVVVAAAGMGAMGVLISLTTAGAVALMTRRRVERI